MIEEYTFKSATEYLDLFSINGKFSNISSGKYVFRGLKDIKYELIPKALREDKDCNLLSLCSEEMVKTDINKNSELWQILVEHDIIKQFFDISDMAGLSVPEIPKLRRCLDDVSILIKGLKLKKWLPEDMFAITGLAQHYSLPTRLLDWSYDYKVGLYFAVSGFLNNCKNKNEKYEDSILYALNYKDLQWLGKDNGSNYQLHFLRPDYFGNPNLSAQKGVFSVWQLSIDNQEKLTEKQIDRRALDKILLETIIQTEQFKGMFKENKLLYKFIIPANYKKDILRQLARDGYTEANLFPGFDGVSKYIQNRALYV